jgi:MFS family permease
VPLASVPARLVEIVVPSRLGTSFRWLLSSTVVNNVGDGIALAAGPLLVASLTRDPFLVSMALMAQWLPMLLFGVVGGVAADRLDRRRMVVVVNLARAVVLLALVAFIATDSPDLAWALVVLFVLGTAETFADSASGTLLPSLVAREDLGIANARMQGAFLLTNQLVAPPIGAALFAAGMALPFAANAAAFALGALLIARIVGSTRSERTEVAGVWADTVEGLRWLVGHPPMRTLALTIFAFNVTFGAGWGVLVLYAGERLGLGEVGFGLLMAATAVGGLIGTVAYGALERRFRLASLLRVGLLIETGTHLSLALTTTPAVAMATLVVFGAHAFALTTTPAVAMATLVLFGAHAFVWGTLSTVVRTARCRTPCSVV